MEDSEVWNKFQDSRRTMLLRLHQETSRRLKWNVIALVSPEVFAALVQHPDYHFDVESNGSLFAVELCVDAYPGHEPIRFLAEPKI